MKNLALTMIAASILAGCVSVGPDYQRPAMQLPSTNVASTSASADLLTWWTTFQDPVLDSYLKEASEHNQDLLLAAGRLEEARSLANIANANRYPFLDGGLSAAKTRTSENAGKLPSGAAAIKRDYQLGLTASYELDLWGKLSRADEAAKARLLSQEASRGAVLSSLYAAVAQTYFALRAYDAQLELALATQKTRQENLRLQQKRRAAGSIGELDLHQSEAEAAAADILLAQAKQSVATTESALAVLLGRSPAAISKPEIARGSSIDALYGKLATPADLSSDLLNRRPDLIAAEQALVAANADIGQTKAQYFPSIKLTTGIGYESTAMSELTSPTSLLWNLGANLTQPLFRGGAIGAVVAGAEARKTQAQAQYVQAVQNAFKDVHDSLTNLSANQEIYSAANRRAVALKDSLRLATLRYDNGYSSYQELLNTQRDLFQTQASLIDTQRAHLASAVALTKALGGGWERSQSK